MNDFQDDCMNAIGVDKEGHVCLCNWIKVWHKGRDFDRLLSIIEDHVIDEENFIDWPAVWREYGNQ